MLRQIVILLVVSYLTENTLQVEATSVLFKRHLLLHRGPPAEVNVQKVDPITEHYIAQRLDNFNHQDMRTFQMRYLKNPIHFKNGGPVFIMIGGEWEIGPGHILQGQLIYDMARELNGLLVYTEHRFYGKSIPRNTTSIENLKYLSVDQSLADLAHFVREITSDKELNATGGVIVVGGSYAATMAAWFRQKYPQLVKGAFASSAPLQAKLNFFEYTETVANSIRQVGGDDCYYTIENIFWTINELFDKHKDDTLKTLFNLCAVFDTNNILDVWSFNSAAKGIFDGAVQYHRPGTIETYCENLTKEDENEGNKNQALLNFAEIFRKHYLAPNDTCIDASYEADISEMRKNDTEHAMELRPWYYQTCSEFGWYQTTDTIKQPFGKKIPVEYYLQICQDAFGDVFNNSTYQNSLDHTNDLYGGFSPAVTNVYFTHGSLDPWHRMGIVSDLNEHSPSSVIPGIAHCSDMNSINYETDSKELISSKVNILNLVKKWLKY